MDLFNFTLVNFIILLLTGALPKKNAREVDSAIVSVCLFMLPMQ